MTRPPAYQEYAGDELARRLGLSLAADGATTRLERVMWSQSAGQCSVLDDDKLLAGILGVRVEDWMSLREEIFHGRKLFIQKDGRIFSPRLKDEAVKQRKYRKLQAKKIRKGVEARVTRGLSTGEARVTSSSPIPSPIPSSSSSSKEKENTHTLLKKESGCVSSFMSQEPEAERAQAHKEPSAWRADAAQAACDVFLAAYPKKTATGDVEAWFRTNPVTPNLLCDMELAIKRQTKMGTWMKDEGRWIPEPMKWLKGKRWKDAGVTVKRRLMN